MKILYILTDKDFFSPPLGGAASHVSGIFNGLRENNIEVEIIIRSGSKYKITQDFKNYVQESALNKILTIRNKNIIIRKNFLNLPIIFFLSINNNVAAEINGLSLQNLKETNFKFIYNAFLSFHRIALHKCKTLYVVNKTLKKDLNLPKITHVIPNGIPKSSISRLNFAKSGKINLLFFGKLQSYNDWSLLSEFAKKNPQVDINIVGDGPDSLNTNKIFKDKKNVYLHGFLTKDELLSSSLINARTIGIVPAKDCKDSLYLSPIKLYDYLSFKIPVCMSEIIRQNGENYRGLVEIYETSNIDSFSSAITKLSSCIDEFEDFVFYEIEKQYSWKSQMNKLIKYISANA